MHAIGLVAVGLVAVSGAVRDVPFSEVTKTKDSVVWSRVPARGGTRGEPCPLPGGCWTPPRVSAFTPRLFPPPPPPPCQLVLFYDGTSPASYATALHEVEAVEKSSSEDFSFLKVDVSKPENVKEAAKVQEEGGAPRPFKKGVMGWGATAHPWCRGPGGPLEVGVSPPVNPLPRAGVMCAADCWLLPAWWGPLSVCK
jgi:hypothetical protein